MKTPLLLESHRPLRRSTIMRGRAALFAVGLATLLAQMTGRAEQATDPLTYSSGFLVTGNYAVGGVDFNNSANVPVGGFATGTINISQCSTTVTTNCVPAGSDILAAYLYWETIHLTSLTSPEAGVTFDNQNVVNTNVAPLKSNFKNLGTGASCYSSGNNAL